MHEDLMSQRKSAIAAITEKGRQHTLLSQDHYRRYMREVSRAETCEETKRLLKGLIHLDQRKLEIVSSLLLAKGRPEKLDRSDSAHASRIDSQYVVRVKSGWYAASERLIDALAHGITEESGDDDDYDLQQRQQNHALGCTPECQNSLDEETFYNDGKNGSQGYLTDKVKTDPCKGCESQWDRKECPGCEHDDEPAVARELRENGVATRWIDEVEPPASRRKTTRETVEEMAKENGDDG